ncbi:MAG TPA: hypothetical protein VF020_18470 [Chthoniobacterales bacterium]
MNETTGSENISEKAKDQAAEIKESVEAAVDQASQTVNAFWTKARTKFSDLQSLEARVREQPVQAVLVAFIAGVIVSLLLRK